MLRNRFAPSSAPSAWRSPRNSHVCARLRRDGRAAQVLILAVMLAWIALATPVLTWLMPGQPWLVLFLVLAVPAATLLFVVGHALGWWDGVHDADPLGAHDSGRPSPPSGRRRP